MDQEFTGSEVLHARFPHSQIPIPLPILPLKTEDGERDGDLGIGGRG